MELLGKESQKLSVQHTLSWKAQKYNFLTTRPPLLASSDPSPIKFSEDGPTSKEVLTQRAIANGQFWKDLSEAPSGQA